MLRKTKEYGDKDIINILRNGNDVEKRRLVNHLYIYFQNTKQSIIKKYKKQLGVTEDNILEAYHDSIITFIRNIEESKYQEKGKGLNAYFYGIHKRILLGIHKKEIRRKRIYQELVFDDLLEIFPSKRIVKTILDSGLTFEDLQSMALPGILKTRPKCKSLLTAMFMKRWEKEAIWEEFGPRKKDSFSSVFSNCKKDLENILRELYGNLEQ